MSEEIAKPMPLPDHFKEKKEFPFPNEAIKLLMKIHSQSLLSHTDYFIISNLLERYLELRTKVFHEY